MKFIVRKSYSSRSDFVSSLNTDETYTNEDLAAMKFIGWVNHKTYEDDWDGELAMFKSPKGHVVFFIDADLEQVA